MAVRAVAPQTQERALSGLKLHPRYEVLAVLGAGSYGTVVGCYDREAQRHVAIKRCRSLFEDLIDCKRVLRELAIQRRLDHRNVARIHSAFLPDGISAFSEVYIVMERCHTDLHKLIGSVVSMEYRHISVMIYGLLAGLHYLHSAGIYHRDLKPANCLVDHNCEVKICDFGLSKALAEEDDADWADDGDVDDVPLCPPQPVLRRELTTHVVTRWYRAPEVILLFQEYTGAIDMWSAGCILAELLQTLQVPYDRRHPLFPGSSCFPLSPRGNEKGEPKDEDQLTQIFNVLGTPSCDEAWLQHARRYVALFGRRPGSGLAAALPFAAPEWLSLLEGMLRVDPSKRLTVHQALQHGVFRGRRDAARERPAGGCVALKFEAEPQLSEQRLRLLFNEEILEIGRRGGA